MVPPAEIAILAAIAICALFLIMLLVQGRLKKIHIQASLPEAKRVGALERDHLLELRRMLGARLARDATQLPRHEVELTQHALWLAMLLEAGADDEIDVAETDFVTKLYGEIVTNEPDRNHIFEAGDRVLRNRHSALFEIGKAADVSMQSKMHILQGAFLVSVANNVFEPTEANCLREIADALAISADEQVLMFDELAESLDYQVAKRDFLFWEAPRRS